MIGSQRVWIMCTALLALAGCNSSSSGSSSESEEQESPPRELPELTLNASSHELEVRLNWSGAEEVDVYFARDPECNWDAYGSCPGGGLLTEQDGDQVSVQVEDGLTSDRAHWFVVRTEDGRESEMVAGRPWRATPNHTVYDMKLFDDTLYLGGRFDQLGASLGGLGLFDHAGNLTGALPWTDNRVLASAPTSQGGLFLGGRFKQIGGKERTYVAQLDQYGRVTDWAVDLEDYVYAMALGNDRVFIGGEFDDVEGDSQYQNLAALSVSDGSVADGWSVLVNRDVYALALTDEALFVGGRFTLINGDSRRGIVALDPASGAVVDGWQGHTDHNVLAIAVSDSMVFAGGRFSEANGQTQAYLAAFDQGDGSLVENWDAELNERAEVLALDEERLYVGGRFTQVQGQDQRHLVALEAATGEMIETWRPDVPEEVNAIAVHDGRVYLGLDDPLEDGEYVMVLDADTGERIQDWNLGLDNDVTHIGLYQEQLLIGGQFETGKGIPGTANLVALEKDTGRVKANWTAPIIEGQNSPIETLAIAGDRLFFGGRFDTVDGVSLSNLAQVDRHTGKVNADWTPEASHQVDVLQVDGQRLYVGGNFMEINSEDRYRVAALDLDTGELDTQWVPVLDGRVYAIETGNGFIALGGTFSTADSQDRQRIAIYSFNGDLMTEFPDYEANSTVRALLMEGDILYAGGAFRSLGGVDRYRTAAIDLATTQLRTWHASIEPQTTFTSRDVRAMASDPYAVYAGGRFSYESQGIELNHLGAFNRLSGIPLEWYPGLEDNRAKALIAEDGLVYVAGGFDQVAGHPARYMVVLEGVGHGPDAEVVW